MQSLATKAFLAQYAGKRKHGSQLEKHEETTLWRRLKSVQEWEWEIDAHALDRLKEKKIRASKQDIISTIFHASIIEYKVDYRKGVYDERVVLRSKAITNDTYNLHVVYSLTKKRVVTVWLNHFNDRHETLNWKLYDKNVRIPA